MKFFLQESIVPPGGWHYVHAESGRTIHAGSFSQLASKTRQFLEANNFPVPTGFKQLIAEQVCYRNPEYCGDTEPITMAEKMRNFGLATKRWIKGGFKVVPDEVFAIRLATCEECPMYAGDSGFGFTACGKCGCTRLKIFAPEETCPLDPPKWGKHYG